ncbi:hypothetical protein ACP70R_018405 [Stipagrostis hirtigluma subsp. patula]
MYRWIESMDDVQETTTTTMAAVADHDMISELPDDVLLPILAFLPEASDVARTFVLSRRWRYLWHNAINLRFTVGEEPRTYSEVDDADDARRLIDGASAVLARRAGGGPDVEDVEMSFVYSSKDNTYHEGPEEDGPYSIHSYLFWHYHAADITSEHVAAWLLFAARRVTRRFTLAVPTLPKQRRRAPEVDDDDGHQPEEGADLPVAAEEAVREEEEAAAASERVLLAELPCTARAQQLSLTLGKAILTVPSTGDFHALTDLLLSHARLYAGRGDDLRLGHLLSSPCCPRLRRAQLSYITGLATLRLAAAGTLEELRLRNILDLRTLDVDAPGLRVLAVKDCGGYAIKAATILAPRLEALGCGHMCPAEKLRFAGAASLRRIDDLEVWTHRLPHERLDSSAAMWFLRHCTSVRHLGVRLNLSMWPPENLHGDDMAGYVDMMADAPQLSNISNLTIKAQGWFSRHAIGATVAKLIAKCTAIECLSIKISTPHFECSDTSCICDHPKGWEDHKISLQHLRNAEVRGYHQQLDSHRRLVRLLLASAPILERMTVSLKQKLVLETDLEDYKDEYFDISSYGGRWAPYVWECSELGFIRPVVYEWLPGNYRGEGAGES